MGGCSEVEDVTATVPSSSNVPAANASFYQPIDMGSETALQNVSHSEAANSRQPQRKKKSGSSAEGAPSKTYRVWRSITGSMNVVACFDEFLPNGRVRLQLRDQKATIDVDFDALSWECQQLLRRQKGDASNDHARPQIDNSMREFTKGWIELVQLRSDFLSQLASIRAPNTRTQYETARLELEFAKKWNAGPAPVVDLSLPILITGIKELKARSSIEKRITVIGTFAIESIISFSSNNDASVELSFPAEDVVGLSIGDVVALKVKLGLMTNPSVKLFVKGGVLEKDGYQTSIREYLRRSHLPDGLIPSRGGSLQLPLQPDFIGRTDLAYYGNQIRPMLGLVAKPTKLTDGQVRLIPELQAWVDRVVSTKFTKMGKLVFPGTADSIGLTFKLIPAGRFTMGEAKSAHEVTLTKAFMLGTHEVTQAQYEQVMGVNPSHSKGADHPVEMVSWEDAVEFCRKLSDSPAEKSAGRVYRLPTQAEWEYACRAGTTTMYSFGNDESEVGDYAWYYKNSPLKPQPVGSKQPNAWGLYDMHGNVSEWCQDWFGDSPTGAVTNPTGPDLRPGIYRVFRGGAYNCDLTNIRYLRSAFISRGLPSRGDRTIGFRVALTVAINQNER